MKKKGIEVLRKDFWTKISPDDIDDGAMGTTLERYSEDNPIYIGVKQSEFLRQYDPSGHKVHSKIHYPNILKQDEKTGRWYEEEISRVAFSFQQIILTKQLTALCGNPTRFRLPIAEQTETHERIFSEWKEGWSVKDMDILIYNAFERLGKTGDVAVYMYINKTGELDSAIYSFDRGDMLFPHYDSRGRMELFARKYSAINEYGELESRVDVFTDREVSTLKMINSKENENTPTFLGGKYKMEGYAYIDKPRLHGLNFMPIAYYRDNKGAWWSDSQKTIEEFEWAFSCLTHSNLAYAFPIMYIKGDQVEIKPDMVRNTVKAIFMPNKDSEAGFLPRPDGSTSFELQLKKLYDMIYQQSFAVNPPEVRSGDLPGVAIKLLYSPSIEKASDMAKKLNPFLDRLVDMFTFFYGIEMGKITEFKSLKVYAYLEPYVHQNDSEVIGNLEKGVNAGFVSKKTATEVSPYSNNNEIQRLTEQEEEMKKNDLLEDMRFSINGGKETPVIEDKKEKENKEE